jgi:hypothetical protein
VKTRQVYSLAGAVFAGWGACMIVGAGFVVAALRRQPARVMPLDDHLADLQARQDEIVARRERQLYDHLVEHDERPWPQLVGLDPADFPDFDDLGDDS